MVKSGSINGVNFGYQKKSVKPNVRIGKAETAGKLGTAIDTMGAGGLDITLDVIAQSITERDSLIAAFMTEGRGKLKPGTPDNDWYFSGVCGDYSTDFSLSQYNPSVAYPLSFLFETDLPYLISDKVTTIGKQITKAGEEWISGDSIGFNQVQNGGFEETIEGDFTEFKKWQTKSVTQQTSTVEVGTNPVGVAICGSTNVIVTNYGSNTITSFVAANPTQKSSVNVGTNPWGVAVNSAGTRAYVSNAGSNTVSVIQIPENTVTTIPVGTRPQGVLISSDSSKVYVANLNSNSISVINTSTNQVSSTISSIPSPIQLELSPFGSRLYAVNLNSNTVRAILTSNNSVEATINVGTNPRDAVAITGKLYVANSGSNNVTVINTANAPTYTVTKTITVGTFPIGITASADGKHVFVSNQNSNTVSIISTTTDTVVGTIDVGTHPYSITASATKLYVANFDSNNVSVISPLPVILPEIFQSTNHKYGSNCLKIVNSNGLSKFGEQTQLQNFESNVEYTLGFWGHIENPSMSEIILELRNNNSALCSTSSIYTGSFSLATMTYTFTEPPTDATLHVYINGNANITTQHYIDGVFCVKSTDFTEDLINGNITTGGFGGTVDSIPDIQIDSIRYANPMYTIFDSNEYKVWLQEQIITDYEPSDDESYTYTFDSPQTASYTLPAKTYPFAGQTSYSEPTQYSTTGTYSHILSITVEAGYNYSFKQVFGEFKGSTWNYCQVVLYAKVGSGSEQCIEITPIHSINSFELFTLHLGPFIIETGVTVEFRYVIESPYGGTIYMQNLGYAYQKIPIVYQLLHTLDISLSADRTYTIKSLSYQGNTSSSTNAAQFIVKAQLDSNTEVTLDTWSTTGTVPTDRIVSNLSNSFTGSGTLYVRFYGKLANGEGGTVSIRNCYVNYNKATYYVLLNTLQISPSTDQSCTVTQLNYLACTSTGLNPANIQVRLQNGTTPETVLDTWSTASTDPTNRTLTGLNLKGKLNTPSYLKFYGKLNNDTGGTVSLTTSQVYYTIDNSVQSVVTTLDRNEHSTDYANYRLTTVIAGPINQKTDSNLIFNENFVNFEPSCYTDITFTYNTTTTNTVRYFVKLKETQSSAGTYDWTSGTFNQTTTVTSINPNTWFTGNTVIIQVLDETASTGITLTNITIGYYIPSSLPVRVEKLLNTITIDAVENVSHVVVACGYIGSVSSSWCDGTIRMTIQYGTGTETTIDEWTSIPSTSTQRDVNGLNYIISLNTSVIVRFYGIINGGAGGTITVDECYVQHGVLNGYNLLKTITLPASSPSNTITEIGFQGYSSSTNISNFRTTFQKGTGPETTIEEWTNSDNIQTPHKLINQSITGLTNDSTYVRLYGRFSNGTPSNIVLYNSYINYLTNSEQNTGSPTNVYIYNAANKLTKCNVCNKLYLGSSLRINADGLGFFKYYDDYLDNTYQNIVSSQTNVTWSTDRITIDATVTQGEISYTFDVRYPIDGVPFLILNVISGNPQIRIAVNEAGTTGQLYYIDENSSVIQAGSHLWNLYNLANCNLSESTNITIQILPRGGESCVISSFFFWTATITVDAELPKIFKDKINTFRVDMSEDALCLISLGIHDYKWGI